MYQVAFKIGDEFIPLGFIYASRAAAEARVAHCLARNPRRECKVVDTNEPVTQPTNN